MPRTAPSVRRTLAAATVAVLTLPLAGATTVAAVPADGHATAVPRADRAASAADIPAIARIPAEDETTPVAHSGDAADDPAIWVSPVDPSQSLVIGNDKLGALETYDLAGNRVQRLTTPSGFWGNVDVRQDVAVGGRTLDVIADAQGGGLRLFTIDPQTRRLSSVTDGEGRIPVWGEGLCLYQSPTSLYAFVITRAGVVRQVQVRDTDADGLLEGRVVRSFDVGSEAEGCVADDATGALYVSQEDVALWRYSADPDAGAGRTAVDRVVGSGGRLAPDIEGVTLVDLADGGGYLIASAQGTDDASSYFAVYERSDNSFVDAFRVVDGARADDCDHTDGITALAADLGPDYPQGLFVCQDGSNDAPGSSGNQDFTYVSLDAVVDLGQQPPPGGEVAFVGSDATNGNHTSFTVEVPAGVRAGDTLLLMFSRNRTEGTVGTPGGWTALGQRQDQSMQSLVWQRTAQPGDAGDRVRVSTDGWTKGALTVVAYRGASAADPVLRRASAAEAGSGTAHRTPTVQAPEPSVRVSYWAAKSATGWQPPAGESQRSATSGSGGGPIADLVTDSGDAVPAGSQGGLVATTDQAVNKATMWTVLLRPGG